ncbi:hypothetical protein D3C73_1118100 [compost metagenome]
MRARRPPGSGRGELPLPRQTQSPATARTAKRPTPSIRYAARHSNKGQRDERGRQSVVVHRKPCGQAAGAGRHRGRRRTVAVPPVAPVPGPHRYVGGALPARTPPDRRCAAVGQRCRRHPAGGAGGGLQHACCVHPCLLRAVRADPGARTRARSDGAVAGARDPPRRCTTGLRRGAQADRLHALPGGWHRHAPHPRQRWCDSGAVGTAQSRMANAGTGQFRCVLQQ